MSDAIMYGLGMVRPSAEIRLDPAITTAIDRLRAVAPVEQIILFGSRARGDAEDDSDWDLCVLLPDDIPGGLYTPSRLWGAVRELGLPIQVTSMRRSVFAARRHETNALAHDVARDGVLLFDKSSPGAK